MAKLNKLLTDWTTTRAGYITNLNSRLTSTRASRLDNIGTAGDTGGSATAGTIMAKLNALLGSGGSGTKIKSIQHGYVEKASRSSTAAPNDEFDANKNRKIKISTVNINKSVLLSFNEITTVYNLKSAFPLNRVPILYNTYLLQPYYALQSGYCHYSGFSYYIIEFY